MAHGLPCRLDHRDAGHHLERSPQGVRKRRRVATGRVGDQVAAADGGARMSTATAGRAREHRTRDRLAEAGWTPIMRAAASKGAADLLMGHPIHGGALIQVGTESKQLGPADRDRFVTAAELVCALPLLATW